MFSPELLSKIEKIYIKSRYLANDVFAGEYETAFRGRGMEFEEVREYTPGDDIRSIDWNVTARMDKPYIKVFREEREQTLMLLVDASASAHFGSKTRLKKDFIAEISAVLAYAAVKANDKVGLIIFSDQIEKYIPPKKGKAHVWRVISEILSFKPQGKQTKLDEAFTFLNRVLHRKTVCFVVSDFLTQNYEKQMAVAGFKHDLVALMIRDPLESEFDYGGLLTVQDLETGKMKEVDLSSSESRKWFKECTEKKVQAKMRDFRKSRIDPLLININNDYIDVLLKFFRLRDKKMK